MSKELPKNKMKQKIRKQKAENRNKKKLKKKKKPVQEDVLHNKEVPDRRFFLMVGKKRRDRYEKITPILIPQESKLKKPTKGPEQ